MPITKSLRDGRVADRVPIDVPIFGERRIYQRKARPLLLLLELTSATLGHLAIGQRSFSPCRPTAFNTVLSSLGFCRGEPEPATERQ